MTLSMVVEHLSMVVFAIVIAILIGVPLGLLCYLSRAARGVVLRVVDLIQTTPALALLGIIMVTPLGAGKPTVILGLALYSLLPIVRNVTLGLSQVSPAVKEAAKGMGMTRVYSLFHVELPLAMPMLFTGLRIAVVNAMHNSLWSTYTVAATIPIAIIMGLYMQIWRKGDVLGASIIGVVLLALCILTGPYVAAHPETFGWLDIDKKPMSILIPVYGFAASVLPVWMLLLPRDYLSTFLKIGTIGALALGIVFVMPDFNMPAFTEFTKGGGPIVGGPVIPFIFITIACGALSGFHATIGTGTTPKMIGKERDVLFVGYGAMLVEGFVAIMALIAACVLVPADYFAINAPADKFAALGMSVVDLPTLEKEGAESLMHRPGGSVSLAVGMAHIFGQIPWMAHLISYWYHFAIMFEALFILTTVDNGTRVARYQIGELLGNVRKLKKFADPTWKPGNIITTLIATALWGGLLWVGVCDTNGGINAMMPIFGISNQLLAAACFMLVTVCVAKLGYKKYLWIPVVPLVWDVAVTFTADFQKIVGPISYFATASKYQTLIDGGTLEGEALVNAKAALSNAYLDGVLSVFFMVMMGVFLVVGIYQTVKILAKGKFGVETTSEEPFVESEWFAPSSLIATKLEKKVQREYAAKSYELAQKEQAAA